MKKAIAETMLSAVLILLSGGSFGWHARQSTSHARGAASQVVGEQHDVGRLRTVGCEAASYGNRTPLIYHRASAIPFVPTKGAWQVTTRCSRSVYRPDD